MPRHELDAECRALILLGLVPGIGSTLLTKLIAYFGSATACVKASDRALVGAGLSPRVATAVVQAVQADLNTKEEALLSKHQVGLILRDDADYPPLLRHIFDPPPLLYVKGASIQTDDFLAVAIVGSRKASEKGRMVAAELARDLAASGVTVVSGFALGIDTAAHEGALDIGGRTLAVLGCGLGHLYPASNAKLAERVIESGALISELPMSVPPIAGNFPRRNRLISGMTLATLVIEAPLGSGSLITADMALEQGRELFAVPWQENAPHQSGGNRLIEEGATPVTDAAQVLAALHRMPKPSDAPLRTGAGRTPHRTPVPRERPKTDRGEPLSRSDGRPPSSAISGQSEGLAQVAEPTPALEGDEAVVWQALTMEPTHIDALVHLTGLSVGAVSSALIFLEMKSVARQFPGKRFARKS